MPLAAARACLEILSLVHEVAAHGNIKAASDAASAAFMACAVIDAAGMNVRINAAALDDKASAKRSFEELHAIQAQAADRIEKSWPKSNVARL